MNEHQHLVMASTPLTSVLLNNSSSELDITISQLKKTFDCPICLKLMQDPVSTKCGHKFCRICTLNVLDKKPSAPCPVCSEPFNKRNLLALPTWTNLVLKVKELISAFELDCDTNHKSCVTSHVTNQNEAAVSAVDVVLSEYEQEMTKTTATVVQSDAIGTQRLAEDQVGIEKNVVETTVFNVADSLRSLPDIMKVTQPVSQLKRDFNFSRLTVENPAKLQSLNRDGDSSVKANKSACNKSFTNVITTQRKQGCSKSCVQVSKCSQTSSPVLSQAKNRLDLVVVGETVSKKKVLLTDRYTTELCTNATTISTDPYEFIASQPAKGFRKRKRQRFQHQAQATVVDKEVECSDVADIRLFEDTQKCRKRLAETVKSRCGPTISNNIRDLTMSKINLKSNAPTVDGSEVVKEENILQDSSKLQCLIKDISDAEQYDLILSQVKMAQSNNPLMTANVEFTLFSPRHDSDDDEDYDRPNALKRNRNGVSSSQLSSIENTSVAWECLNAATHPRVHSIVSKMTACSSNTNTKSVTESHLTEASNPISNAILQATHSPTVVNVSDSLSHKALVIYSADNSIGCNLNQDIESSDTDSVEMMDNSDLVFEPPNLDIQPEHIKKKLSQSGDTTITQSSFLMKTGNSHDDSRQPREIMTTKGNDKPHSSLYHCHSNCDRLAEPVISPSSNVSSSCSNFNQCRVATFQEHNSPVLSNNDVTATVFNTVLPITQDSESTDIVDKDMYLKHISQRDDIKLSASSSSATISYMVKGNHPNDNLGSGLALQINLPSGDSLFDISNGEKAGDDLDVVSSSDTVCVTNSHIMNATKSSPEENSNHCMSSLSVSANTISMRKRKTFSLAPSPASCEHAPQSLQSLPVTESMDIDQIIYDAAALIFGPTASDEDDDVESDRPSHYVTSPTIDSVITNVDSVALVSLESKLSSKCDANKHLVAAASLVAPNESVLDANDVIIKPTCSTCSTKELSISYDHDDIACHGVGTVAIDGSKDCFSAATQEFGLQDCTMTTTEHQISGMVISHTISNKLPCTTSHKLEIQYCLTEDMNTQEIACKAAECHTNDVARLETIDARTDESDLAVESTNPLNQEKSESRELLLSSCVEDFLPHNLIQRSDTVTNGAAFCHAVDKSQIPQLSRNTVNICSKTSSDEYDHAVDDKLLKEWQTDEKRISNFPMPRQSSVTSSVGSFSPSILDPPYVTEINILNKMDVTCSGLSKLSRARFVDVNATERCIFETVSPIYLSDIQRPESAAEKEIAQNQEEESSATVAACVEETAANELPCVDSKSRDMKSSVVIDHLATVHADTGSLESSVCDDVDEIESTPMSVHTGGTLSGNWSSGGESELLVTQVRNHLEDDVRCMEEEIARLEAELAKESTTELQKTTEFSHLYQVRDNNCASGEVARRLEPDLYHACENLVCNESQHLPDDDKNEINQDINNLPIIENASENYCQTKEMISIDVNQEHSKFTDVLNVSLDANQVNDFKLIDAKSCDIIDSSDNEWPSTAKQFICKSRVDSDHLRSDSRKTEHVVDDAGNCNTSLANIYKMIFATDQCELGNVAESLPKPVVSNACDTGVWSMADFNAPLKASVDKAVSIPIKMFTKTDDSPNSDTTPQCADSARDIVVVSDDSEMIASSRNTTGSAFSIKKLKQPVLTNVAAVSVTVTQEKYLIKDKSDLVSCSVRSSSSVVPDSMEDIEILNEEINVTSNPRTVVVGSSSSGSARAEVVDLYEKSSMVILTVDELQKTLLATEPHVVEENRRCQANEENQLPCSIFTNALSTNINSVIKDGCREDEIPELSCNITTAILTDRSMGVEQMNVQNNSLECVITKSSKDSTVISKHNFGDELYEDSDIDIFGSQSSQIIDVIPQTPETPKYSYKCKLADEAHDTVVLYNEEETCWKSLREVASRLSTTPPECKQKTHNPAQNEIEPKLFVRQEKITVVDEDEAAQKFVNVDVPDETHSQSISSSHKNSFQLSRIYDQNDSTVLVDHQQKVTPMVTADLGRSKKIEKDTKMALSIATNIGFPSCSHWVFVVSGLNRTTDQVAVDLFSQKLGCRISNKFSCSTTHVLVKQTDEQSRQCQRTLKYFQGIANKLWVVSVRWAIDSIRRNELLPVEDYEITSDTAVDEDHCGPRRSRLSIQPLLARYEVCCLGTFNDITRDDLHDLAESCGASSVQDPAMFTFDTSRTQVIVIEDSTSTSYSSAELKKLFRRYRTPIVNKEWLLDTIGTFHIKPLATYNACPI